MHSTVLRKSVCNVVWLRRQLDILEPGDRSLEGLPKFFSFDVKISIHFFELIIFSFSFLAYTKRGKRKKKSINK